MILLITNIITKLLYINENKINQGMKKCLGFVF